MPIKIIKSDLASAPAEAIVYAETKQPITFFNFNPLLFEKNGRELLTSREAIQPLVIGEVKLDPTPRLSSQYIIHTSAPVWHGGLYQEKRVLKRCYEKIFHLVLEKGFHSIALPIIGTNHLGYPKKMTQKMAFSCIQEFLSNHPAITVFLVVPELSGILLPGNRYSDVKSYLRKNAEKEPADTPVAEQDLSGNGVSHTKRQELILAYCQSQNIQDPYEINQILFRFEEEQLDL